MRTGEAASCTAGAARRTIAVAVTVIIAARAGNRELWRADRIGAIMPVMDTEPGGGMGRCYVSALSEHPDSAQAAAEVTAQVLGRLGADAGAGCVLRDAAASGRRG